MGDFFHKVAKKGGFQKIGDFCHISINYLKNNNIYIYNNNSENPPFF